MVEKTHYCEETCEDADLDEEGEVWFGEVEVVAASDVGECEHDAGDDDLPPYCRDE